MARLKTIAKRLGRAPDRLKSASTLSTNYGKDRGGRPWRRIVERVKVRDNYTCQMCGRVTEQGECDHIVPKAEGGTDHMHNLQWLCKEPCHQQKSAEEAKRGVARQFGSDKR